MPRKTKRDNLPASKPPTATPIAPDPGRQPRIVGWLVLIVGGFSSWYWYRPLPDKVNQTVHSMAPSTWPTSASGPKSLWSDQGLVIPSTTETSENLSTLPDQRSNKPNDESRLIGAPKVTLVPWNEVQHDIRDVLKTERVPMVPLDPDLKQNKPLVSAPQVWTSDQQRADRTGESTHSSLNWPDQGYVPPAKSQRDQRRAAVQITTQIPPLLETGMKSIRTVESNVSTFQSEPARQPQFIRQPHAGQSHNVGQSLRD